MYYTSTLFIFNYIKNHFGSVKSTFQSEMGKFNCKYYFKCVLCIEANENSLGARARACVCVSNMSKVFHISYRMFAFYLIAF